VGRAPWTPASTVAIRPPPERDPRSRPAPWRRP
jgi:hypothetical protein